MENIPVLNISIVEIYDEMSTYFHYASIDNEFVKNYIVLDNIQFQGVMHANWRQIQYTPEIKTGLEVFLRKYFNKACFLYTEYDTESFAEILTKAQTTDHIKLSCIPTEEAAHRINKSLRCNLNYCQGIFGLLYITYDIHW